MVQAVSRDKGKAASSYFVQFKPGEYIFKAGDSGAEMFIIEEGRVEILVGEKSLVQLERGDFFGEMAILEDMPRSSNARAMTECKLLRIDRVMFDQVLRQNPEIAIRMMRGLSHRLREATSGRKNQPAPDPAAGATTMAPLMLGWLELTSGARLPITAEGELTIGRFDPSTGIRPAIDLGEADTERTISRRHAKILREGASFHLVEEIGTSNGTYVNGKQLTAGIPFPIKDGDELTFGRLKTTFRATR